VLLRDMAYVYRDLDARPVPKVELNKAVAVQEKLRRHACWT